MSAIIPFESAKLPAHLANRTPGINKDVLGAGRVYPVLSIKGKVWALVKGKERKIITREFDGEKEAVASLQLTVARANTKYRVFYAESFTEENSEGKKPDCYSTDGVAPAADARTPQSKKCQGCPQNVWGVREGKGTACASKTRLAVVDPVQLEKDPEHEPILLNVPAASRKSFAQAVDAAEQRGIDYNALVMRVSFDAEAASPKLVFKPVGWLDAGVLAKVQALYENETVLDMMGLKPRDPDTEEAPTAQPEVDTSELEAAIAARKATEKAKDTAKPAAKPEVKEPVAEEPSEEELAAIAEAEAAEAAAKAAAAKAAAAKAAAAAKKASAAQAKAAEVTDVEVKAPKAEAKPKADKPKAAVADDADALLAEMDALLGNSDD